MRRPHSIDAFVELFFEEPAPQAFANLSGDLDLVFGSKSLGFRELLATIVYGRHLDDSYDPSTRLYDCNPRTLYERDMRPVLVERGVPCGQSGPLNIAKATSALNVQWAAQRRPPEHARAVLRVVDAAMAMSRKDLAAFAKELGRRFDGLALAVTLTQNNLAPVDSSVRLAAVTRELIETYPLGGAIPQALCGLLLMTEFRFISAVHVDGALDSSSTTNLTSKKVGDLTVEQVGIAIPRIYEVTVKSFSLQRISECTQSIRGFFEGRIPDDLVVTVLCRPQDVPDIPRTHGSRGHLAEHAHDGVYFEFIDIFEWLAIKVAEFRLDDRRHFFQRVQLYLNGTRIPAEVRRLWAAAFAEP